MFAALDLAPTRRMVLKKISVSKVLTLSSYGDGCHITEGLLDEVGGEASFAESFRPLHRMLESFADKPLGTKTRVTMETVKP